MPIADMTGDRLGSNALAPVFWSSHANSLKQELARKHLVCNPPFRQAGIFVEAIEEAVRREPKKTRALLIVPHRSKDNWQAAVIKSDLWDVLVSFVAGTQFFTGASNSCAYNL